jgi:hypothetical protein
MVRFQEHAEEIFWLQRRIDFLHELDDLLMDVASEDIVNCVASQYVKVENPIDLVNRLKDIYGDDLK